MGKDEVQEATTSGFRVIIVGFGIDEYDKVDKVMQELISASGCFLFTIVCGGLSGQEYTQSVGARWAERNGLPIEACFKDDVGKLVKELTKECDYIVAKAGSGQFVTKLLGKFREAGKHGTVVRE